MNKNKDNSLIITTTNTKIQKIFSSIILFIVAIISFLIGFIAIIKTAYFNLVINFASEKVYIKLDNIFFNVLFTLITIGFFYFLYKKILPKINKRILLIIMLAFSLLIGFWWVNYIKFRPIADQSLVVYCAEKLLDHDVKTILEPGEYLNRNPHQLGFVVYLMTIFKIFNTRNPLIAQNLAVIYSAISGVLLYFIVKHLFEEEIVHKIALIFITFFSIYFAFFCTHVYGNIPGLMFGLIALLFTLKFLESNNYWHLAIVAITITISYLLKSNYEIFLFAIIIEFLLKALKDWQIKLIFTAIGLFIFVFGLKSVLYNHFEKATGYSLDTGVPMTSYIYMGIAEPVTLTPGWYTGDVEIIYNQSGYDSEKSEEITEEILNNRLKYLASNPKYTYDFFKNKLQTTWLNPTFQVFWCSTPSTLLDLDPAYNSRIAPKKLLISILCGKAYNIEERVMDIYQILVFLSASFALFLLFKEGSLRKMLLPIIFLGGFIFHFIWETKAIYVIQYFYLLLPSAAFGLYRLLLILDNKIKRITK